jgi:hypothetical protein
MSGCENGLPFGFDMCANWMKYIGDAEEEKQKKWKDMADSFKERFGEIGFESPIYKAAEKTLNNRSKMMAASLQAIAGESLEAFGGFNIYEMEIRESIEVGEKKDEYQERLNKWMSEEKIECMGNKRFSFLEKMIGEIDEKERREKFKQKDVDLFGNGGGKVWFIDIFERRGK